MHMAAITKNLRDLLLKQQKTRKRLRTSSELHFHYADYNKIF